MENKEKKFIQNNVCVRACLFPQCVCTSNSKRAVAIATFDSSGSDTAGISTETT